MADENEPLTRRPFDHYDTNGFYVLRADSPLAELLIRDPDQFYATLAPHTKEIKASRAKE